jgi:hypothetical protein
MPGQAVSLFNDPNFQAQAAQIQQRQALANALLEQGMTPVDTNNRQVGGIAYHVSPMEGLAKLVQAYYGAKMGQQARMDQASLMQQAYANALQKYQPGQAASYSPDQVSTASSQALANGGGQTNSNAAAMGQALVNQQPANQGSVNPYNPAGVPAALLADAAMGLVPDEVLKAQLSGYQATPATQMATQAGTSVAAANQGALAKANTDPEILKLQQAGFTPQQIQNYLAQQQAKAGYIEPVQVRQGNLALDPRTNQPLAYNPNMGKGITPQFVNLNGVTVPVGARALPGYSGANAGIEGAEQGAKSANSIYTGVTGPDGEPVSGYGNSLFGGRGGAPSGTATAGVPSGASQPMVPGGAPPAPAYQIAPKPGVISGPTMTKKTLNDQGGDLLKAAQADSQGNQQTYQYLNEIEGLVRSGAKFGPLSADIARWKAMFPGVDLSGAQTNQDVMRKIAANLAGVKGTRSDADLANWQHAYPSGEMTNDAILQVLPMLRGTLGVSDARAKVLTNVATQSGMDKVPQAYTRFNQLASPSVVSDGQALAQASRQGPQAVQQFMSQYKAAHKDWQTRLPKIQALDQMGAF